MEQRVRCVPDTVMRIASISKSLTMAIVAKLVEEDKLDLDKPVQEYVKEFPEKTFDGEKVSKIFTIIVFGGTEGVVSSILLEF